MQALGLLRGVLNVAFARLPRRWKQQMCRGVSNALAHLDVLPRRRVTDFADFPGRSLADEGDHFADKSSLFLGQSVGSRRLLGTEDKFAQTKIFFGSD